MRRPRGWGRGDLDLGGLLVDDVEVHADLAGLVDAGVEGGLLGSERLQHGDGGERVALAALQLMAFIFTPSSSAFSIVMLALAAALGTSLGGAATTAVAVAVAAALTDAVAFAGADALPLRPNQSQWWRPARRRKRTASEPTERLRACSLETLRQSESQ